MKKLITLLFVCAHFLCVAQFFGPTTVPVGYPQDYSFSNGTAYTNYRWTNTLSSPIVDHGPNAPGSSTFAATVTWTSVGSGSLNFLDGNFNLVSSLNITVVVGDPNTTISTVENCNSTVVTCLSSPPSGVVWYWQTSSGGTSTSNSSSAAFTTTSSNVFLRAYHSASGHWSSGSQSFTVTIISPLAPPGPGVNGNVISNHALTVSLAEPAVAGATSYQWFNSDGSVVTGATTLIYSPTVQPNVTQTYYIASQVASCLSLTKTQVTASLYPEPVITVSNNGYVVFGANAGLSVNNFVYDSYQWLGPTGLPISNATTASYQTNLPGTYKVVVTKGNSAPFTSPGVLISSVNYIVETDVMVPGVATTNAAVALAIGPKTQTTQFFDGLGRLMQTVSMQASPLRNDIIQPVQYDAFGREATKYLPYQASQTSGWYKPNAIGTPGNYTGSDHYNFYNGNASDKIANDPAPYAQTIFEPSPLNRVAEQGAPGAVWQPVNPVDDISSNTDKTSKIRYEVNTANEVLLFKYNNSTATVNLGDGSALQYYSLGQLSVRRMYDERNNEVAEYTDKTNHIVCKKVQYKTDGTTALYASTYYVYDNLGNLMVVFQPEAIKAIIKQGFF